MAKQLKGNPRLEDLKETPRPTIWFDPERTAFMDEDGERLYEYGDFSNNSYCCGVHDVGSLDEGVWEFEDFKTAWDGFFASQKGKVAYMQLNIVRSPKRQGSRKKQVAIPPPEGWPGGNDYGKNGARLGRKA